MNEKEKMEKWLDSLVEIADKYKEVCEFNDEIKTNTTLFDDFGMYFGLPKVARVIGAEIVTNERIIEGRRVVFRHFYYKGYKFADNYEIKAPK